MAFAIISLYNLFSQRIYETKGLRESDKKCQFGLTHNALHWANFSFR